MSSHAYIPALDGMRGIAVLMVVCFHAGIPMFSGGFLGVDLFFVLSGFFITRLLLRDIDSTGVVLLLPFLRGRVRRLLPGLLFLIISLCALSIIFEEVGSLWSPCIESAMVLTFMVNWMRAFAMRSPDYLGHTWSLAIEFQFYVLWALLVAALARINRVHKFGIILAIVLMSISLLLKLYFNSLGGGFGRAYNGLDTHLGGLMFGAVVAFYMDRYEGNTLVDYTGTLEIVGVSAVLMILLLCIYSNVGGVWVSWWGGTLMEIAATALLLNVLLRPGGGVSKMLSWRPLVMLGSISYGLYLWHYPVLRAFLSLGYADAVNVVLAIAISMLAALISYRYLEQPVVKTSRGRYPS
jgi:peptidoglycan/LPS O-acetylase OafA/YrhL